MPEQASPRYIDSPCKSIECKEISLPSGDRTLSKKEKLHCDYKQKGTCTLP